MTDYRKLLLEACAIASEHIRDRNGGPDATRIEALRSLATAPPFCGGEALVERDERYGFDYVMCGDCGASAGAGATRDPLTAKVAKWNTRAAPPEGAPAAAPAPGALSEAQRRAIGIAREHMLAEPERWAGVLGHLLSQPAPRPATLTVGEREAVSRARHLINSFTGVKDTQAALDRLLASDKLDMVPPRAGALCRAAIKWREWARKLERTAPEDADEELIAAVDEFLGIPSSETP